MWRHLALCPLPSLPEVSQEDFGTQPSPSAGQGTLADQAPQGLVPQQHVSPFSDTDLAGEEASAGHTPKSTL